MPYDEELGEELGEALRRTGEEFSTDQRALVEAGHARGRRMVRRRRATVFGGAVAVVALAVTGAVVVPTLGGDSMESASPAGSSKSTKADESKQSSEASGPEVGAEQLIKTLKSLLPEGQVSGEEGRGTGEGPMPYAHVVFDEGKGKGSVGISFNRVDDPAGQSAKDMITCPDKVITKFDTCKSTKLADGSQLMILQGYVYPDQRADVKEWRATLVTPEGHLIDAMEHNAAAEKGSPVTRPEPPLSPDQLKALVTSDAWDPVYAAPEPQKPGAPGDKGEDAPEKSQNSQKSQKPGSTTADPGSESALDEQAVRSTLISLLPKGLKVTHRGGGGDYAFVVVDDGKGASLIGVNVQPNMDDVRGELFNGSEELPDGTVYSWQESAGDKGVEGAVMWTADTLRPDGLRVVVSAFNAGTQHDAPSRETPALTQDQLKSLATNAKWAELVAQ